MIRYGMKDMGRHATACLHFTPKKRDYPVKEIGNVCPACKAEIEPPLGKMVQCAACGSKYKPAADKILVLYNYEDIFKEKYRRIVGLDPPQQAIVIPASEQTRKQEWKDLLVIYPTEKIRVTSEGLRMRREGVSSLERYERIYQIVDYGALTERQKRMIERRGIVITRKALLHSRETPIPLYPSPSFVEKIRRLRVKSPMIRALAESAVLSVIVATKRLAKNWPARTAVVNRQLIEYARMLRQKDWSLDTLLAYEARISNLYWRVYKWDLKSVGLDFRSRVRDRFVRELVRNARARARGYSPANAAINYLHQRRLAQCRLVNSALGIGWIGCEGLIHTAEREPPIGLLLDLSDPFKLADREKFIEACVKFSIKQEDFVSSLGRNRIRYYYPATTAIDKLEELGFLADQSPVYYDAQDLPLMKAYERYVRSFKDAVMDLSPDRLSTFTYGAEEDQVWVQEKLSKFVY